jgi:hypothetical protein
MREFQFFESIIEKNIPATHSSNSYPSAVDIRNTTTKIISITLTTCRITTEYFKQFGRFKRI